MPSDAEAQMLRESRMDEAVVEYCRAVDTGRPPDRDRFLAQYPDLADDLTAYLDAVAVIGQCVPFGTGLAPRQRLCPHCRSALSGGEPGAFCAGCGSRFRLDCGRTAALPSGGRIGRFVLTAIAGRGAFGTVFRAWDPVHDRPVAVKVPRTDTLTAAEDIERFFREATYAARLSHPGIVAVYEAGEADGVPYIASEFVPGQTLAALLRDGRLQPGPAAEMIGAIATALAYAHENGVVHRDVKPSNILIGRDNVPRLTDFGLALFSGSDPTLTRDGEILGAPAYMSPEQAAGRSHEADARSDVYSLGVVLYELLTGGRPFVGIVPVVLHRIRNENPCAPRRLNARISRDLETICLKCLRKEPSARYATAAELAEDLQLFRAGLPIRARPLGGFERLVRWARRNRALAAAYVAAAALLVSSTAIATAWAVHASRQAGALQVALNQSRETRAKADLDRGLAEADRGDVGAGLLWMARSAEVAPDSTGEIAWSARANLNAWGRHLPQLTSCEATPPGKVLGFSPDGRAAWYLDTDGRTVRQWDVAAGRTIGPPSAIQEKCSHWRRVRTAVGSRSGAARRSASASGIPLPGHSSAGRTFPTPSAAWHSPLTVGSSFSQSGGGAGIIRARPSKPGTGTRFAPSGRYPVRAGRSPWQRVTAEEPF